MSKIYIIVKGHFSINGNFIGISFNADKIHIYKEQMDLLNLNSINDISFPLFVIGKIKVFDLLDGNPGDPIRKHIINDDGINQTFERLTAMAVFTSFDSLINVYASEIALNERIIEQPLDEIKKNHLEAENAFKEFFKYKISTF